MMLSITLKKQKTSRCNN